MIAGYETVRITGATSTSVSSQAIAAGINKRIRVTHTGTADKIRLGLGATITSTVFDATIIADGHIDIDVPPGGMTLYLLANANTPTYSILTIYL